MSGEHGRSARGSRSIDSIRDLRLDRYNPPELAFTVSCSSGTYIRTLAHDIGQDLGTGAYLKKLRRTHIGGYDIADAVPLGTLTPENWTDGLVETETFLSP